MQTDIVKQWANFGNSAFASLKELGEINGEFMKKLTQRQLDFANTCLDMGAKQVALVVETKGYWELFSGQASLAAEHNETVMEAIRWGMDVMAGSKDKLTSWFENSIEIFTEPLGEAAPVVRAATAKKAA